MPIVILLALASTTCAAISTVLKHLSANRPPRPVKPGKRPSRLAGMLPNRIFLAALLVDGVAVLLQIWALKLGDLSTVQPILTLALVISLGIDHLVSRTRVRRDEAISAGTLVAGLVVFLISSGATHPTGHLEVGRRDVGLVMAGIAAVLWVGALIFTRKRKATVRARTTAVGIAAIYASTAALITSATRIFDRYGLGELLMSWQLWTLIAAAACGVWLNQRAFGMAPLHVTLPVIASLDPLFSIIIGRAVFDERLRSHPGAIALEVVGLGMLLLGVARLSRSQAAADAGDRSVDDAPADASESGSEPDAAGEVGGATAAERP